MSYYFWLGRDAEDIEEYELACHAMHSAALGHEDDGTVVGLIKYQEIK